MAFFSTASSDYANAINSLVKPTYESKYNNKIEEQLNKILNREDFSYDFNADPLYQNYKDQYTKLGKEAAMNASASASALTGGYGNSYAGTAASQANQQYLTQLNERIPELYNAAMNKYQMETENLYNQFGALQTEEGRQYGMYRDNVSDYYNDWGNLQQGFSTAQAHEEWQEGMDYQKERDAVSDAQWNKQFDYNTSRDNVSDSQWDKQFAYQQARDAVADSQWEKEYQLALSKARKSGSSGSSGSSRGGNVTTQSNVSNSKGMTFTDANEHLITMMGMNDSDAASYAKSLQQNGYISKEDANYLYQEYLNKKKENNKTGTTLDIINGITSVK